MNKCVKKVLLILVFILILSISNVSALTKAELKKFNLTRIKSYSLESGYSNVQGGTITDKYIVLAETYSDDGKTALIIIDKNTLKKVKTITKYQFNHANDMTFNTKNNKVIVTAGSAYPKVFILNKDTFELEKTEITARGYSSIAYDEKNNKYIARKGQKAFILNSKFKEESSFKISSEDLTTQGFEAYNGKIYYTCYEAGRVTTYQKKYTNILKANENVVIVYDIESKKKEKVYYIPQVNKEGVYPGEVEGIGFNGNKPIIWSNKSGYINLFTPVINEQELSVELKIKDLKINDKNVLMKIYDNNALVDKAYNENGKFTFNNIKTSKETALTYTLKIESDNYKLNNNKIKIKTTYDPFTNKLIAEYNKEVSITETTPKQDDNKDTNEEKNNNKQKEESKDNKQKEESNNKQEEKKNEKEENTKQNEVVSSDGTPKQEEKTYENNKKAENSQIEVESKEKEEPQKKEEVINDNNMDEKIELYDNNENSGENIEVPDTTTKKSLSIIGILFIIGSFVLIKAKQNN